MHDRHVFQSCGPGRRQPLPFHLPAVCPVGNALPGKPHRRPAILIETVEQLHQPIAVFARRRVVKQAELRHTFAGEIAQHHAAAMIAVAGDEDPFERPPGGLNDVTAVLGGRRQAGGRLIAVIGGSTPEPPKFPTKGIDVPLRVV